MLVENILQKPPVFIYELNMFLAVS